MLTKGYIVELATKAHNKYKVRIPLFDSAGQDTLTNSDNIVEATLCYDAGILNSLKVDDCVFVEFENDEEGKPVILGNLYTNDSKGNRGQGILNTLNVSSSATLPLDTTLGDVSLQSIIDNLTLSKVNSERIDQLYTGQEYMSSSMTQLKDNILFEKSFHSTKTLKITSSALTNGCLFEIVHHNPNDSLCIYGVKSNNIMETILPNNKLCEIKFNCCNGGNVYCWGYDSSNNIYTNTNGTTYSSIYIYGSYYCVKVMNGCLDNDNVKYSSFDEVLESSSLPSITSSSNSYSTYDLISTIKSENNTFSGDVNFSKTLKYKDVEVATKDDITKAITTTLSTAV